MSITLNQFRAASVQHTGRLTLADNNQVQPKRTGFGRFVEWIQSGFISKNQLNAKTKDAFLTAIRNEFGDAMAKQAGHELGKHKSLQDRTVTTLLKYAEENKETFVKQHNASRIAGIHKDIQTALDKHGGMSSIYDANAENPNSTVQGLFKQQFGFSLPPFDTKVTEYTKKTLFDKQLDNALANSKDGMLGDQSFNTSELHQAISESTLRNIWLNKGGMSESQMNEFFSNQPVNVKRAIALVLSASTACEEHPQAKDTITSNIAKFFTQACSRELDSVAEGIVTNGVGKGLLSISTPGVGKVYENMAARYTGGSKVKMLCFAEKSYEAAGDFESAAKIRQSLLQEQKQHIAEVSGKELNQIQLPSTEEDRNRLSQLRKELTPSASETSQKLRTFIGDMYRECLAHCGVNEEDQSLVMFGSGSRDEMYPFSDLEFAVLTKSDEGNEKLHKAITLFDMRITALGETPEGPEKSVPIREGLCLDPGGNCPKGNDTSFVGPPSKILGKLAGDLILVEVFSAVKVLVGSTELCKQYNEGVEKYFTSKAGAEFSKGQDFAINNLKDQVKGMRDSESPIVSTDFSNLQEINAKKLTRFPFFLASSLCKFHGVSPEITNTVERLNALKELGVLTSEETTALVNAFNGFGDLRLEAEMHYGGQVHDILKNDDGKSHTVSEEKWQDMLKLLEPLNAIFMKVERFTQNPMSEFQGK